MTDTNQTTYGFQAEVKQLLKLMIHSLYSNKEIFLRELISNASDALDKLRFESIETPSLLGDDTELRITLDFDADAGTLTISDNGIGMSRDDAAANLGTIARSGTAEFLGKLGDDERENARLIGQFGVGFYASFIVADEVRVESRRADLKADEGVVWTSRGDGEYTLESTELDFRGTRITLTLKAEEREFADRFRIQNLVRRYSDHIAFPVQMPASGEDAEGFETINSATALWTRSRSEVSDDEYREFYQHISHDFEAPAAWSHNKVEGKREYTSLLYVPKRAPFDLWNREAPRGLKLYVQRVFIMDDAEQFLPLYLRFIRGVVDAADLPLNVSRELLQSTPGVEAMRSALTKRALTMLKKLSTDDEALYGEIWDTFGEVLKEGLAEDTANREQLMELLRFNTTASTDASQRESLAQYVERRKEGQEAIYYLTADSLAAAKASPHLEVFRKRGIEVLLLTDRLDEWAISYLTEYDGKPLQDIRRDGLELPEGEPEPAKAEDIADDGVIERLKGSLGDSVADVRASDRLVDSPACLVSARDDIGDQMRRMLEAAGQEVPESKPTLEINLAHGLVRQMSETKDDARFTDLANVVVGQAQIAEGRLPSDPAVYVNTLNRLLSGAVD
ncbi:MAG: molecular chaperone HtpG [Pseudomonadota bacterium]